MDRASTPAGSEQEVVDDGATVTVIEPGPEMPPGPKHDWGHPSCCSCPLRRYYMALMAFLGCHLAAATRLQLYSDPVREGTASVWGRHWDEAFYFFGYAATQLLGGYLAGVLGGQRVFAVGVAGSGMLCFLGPLVSPHSAAGLIGVWVCLGLVQGVTFPSAIALWARWAPPMERTVLSAAVYSGFYSGLPVLPISSAVAAVLGWDWAVYLYGIFSLAWCLVWSLTVFADPSEDWFITESELEHVQTAVGEVKTPPVHPWGHILSSKAVWAIAVAFTGLSWGVDSALLLSPEHMRDTVYRHAGRAFEGLCLLLFSQVSDWLRRDDVSTLQVRRVMATVGFSLQSLFMVVASASDSQDVTSGAVVLTMAASGITLSALLANCLDIGPPHAAVVMGVAGGCAALGKAVLTLLTPQINSESWKRVAITTAVIYLFSLVFFLMFAQGRRQRWVYTPHFS